MKQIAASVITVGDELIIGQTLDSNSTWIGPQLNKMGIWLRRCVAIGDNRKEIMDALDDEKAGSDIILITGGLGPTNDDITKEVLCDYFGAKLVENKEVRENIKQRLASRGLALLERNLKQAEVPDNCIALLNTRGTAPGMWFEQEGKIIVSMPGIPYEMQGMMLKDVLPALKKHFKLPAILHRSLTTFGMAESMVAERLISFEKSLPPHISLAYLPGKGLLKLRLSARSDVEQRAAYRLDQYFGELESILSDITLTNEDIPPEVLIGNLLKEKKLTMATAESCTGGYLAHLITSVPGNSLYYKGTIVSYAVEVKNDLLKVPQDILKKDGVVSEATVKAMVKGVLRLIEADVAMSVSGYMGPDGGEPGKPVGTVWIAAGSRDKILTKEYHLRYDRARNIEITANYVLILLKQFIDQHNDHQ